MTSKHLVDPELLPALEQVPQFDLSEETLPPIRAQIVEMFAHLGSAFPPAPEIARSERFVPGPSGAPEVRVLVYAPRDGRTGRPGYLYIHGGGYVLGTADMSEMSCRALALELGCVVVSVDYRLAPETTFPGNVEDCYAALKWLHSHAAELGVDPARIAIGGESAGGGLAAGLGLLTRDRGEIALIHQHLVYPMIDDRPSAGTNPLAGEFGWTRASNHFGWKCLLGREPGGADVSPYAAAARAETLAGLPPTFIGVGALDLFCDSNLDYARRLIHAGVPVELHVYPGAFHGSDMAIEARVTKQHARDRLEALRTAFARS